MNVRACGLGGRPSPLLARAESSGESCTLPTYSPPLRNDEIELDALKGPLIQRSHHPLTYWHKLDFEIGEACHPAGNVG